MTAEWIEVENLQPVNDTNTTAAVREFMEAVAEVIPDIQYGVRAAQKSATNMVFAYLPGDHITMGRIGFGDFKRRGKPSQEYIVESSHIKNNKYADYNSQRHMTMSKHLAKGVTNAQKYLRRPTVVYTVNLLHRGVAALANSQRSTQRDVVTKAERELFSTSLSHYHTAPRLRLAAEMQRLLDMEHVFLDPTFRGDVAAWLDARRAYEQETDPEFTFVGFTDNEFLGHRATVAEIDKYASVLATDEIAVTELPQDLAGKVAALNMLEPGAWVQGLGCRRTMRTFYVIR